MPRTLRVALLALLVSLLPSPAAAGGFTISLPPDSAVTIGVPSRLSFRVTNTETGESLSRLTLRFPSGYRVTGGSVPPGWVAELGPSASPGESGEISFRTEDEGKCTGAIAPGGSLVFGTAVIAPVSGSVSPDSLVSAQGEQSCRGVVLDPPAPLPSWNRLGIAAALAAGPPILGVGGTLTVTMTVTNRSTVDLGNISPLLSPGGTGGLSGVVGPSPGTLALAPGASGSMTWTARAASAGTVSFSGQAVSQSVTSSPVQSDTIYVGDLDVSLTVAPEQIVSSQDVQVQMTVTNRGPVRVANVTPSTLAFDGTATASPASGPSPASFSVLEPGESATFAWAATITGQGGETYAFSGWASAERDAVVSVNAMSNRGALAQQQLASGPGQGGATLGGGGLASSGSTATTSSDTGGQTSDAGGTATSTTSGGTAAASAGGTASLPPPAATLQFIAVNHDGSQTGGIEFLGAALRDLRILVAWTNLSGSHTQRLDLYAPDGSFYQRLSAQLAGSSTVETRLPVGGTWITEHSLFGAWRIEVFLDNEQMPTASGAIVLDP